MPDDKVHDVLYSEAALALGEIHWMILKATQTMDGERWNTTNLGFGKTYQDTDFGKEVVHEMNRLGMMVDIAHVADKTFWDALEVSKAPIFSSHSSCRALADVPRNMTDEMIVALAKKGGVVQINFSCGFLKAGAGGGRGAPQGPRATLADVVAHIDHVKQIAGVDAVGIGSDFDGIGCTPEGLDDVSKFPNLTRALLEKGYSAEDIRKIYGGNLLRVMRGVEKAAGK